MKNFKKQIIVVTAAFSFFSSLALASVTIHTNIPGVPANTSNACATVFGFYNFALMIGGILAFGAIVYGGVKYTFAAGNPGGQSEGKDWIKSAILGLLLLVGAYTILNVINPDIVTCKLPTLGTIGGKTIGSTGSTIPAGPSGVCPGGTFTCVLDSCVDPTGSASTPETTCVSDCSQCVPDSTCRTKDSCTAATTGATVWQCPTDKSCYWANDNQTQASCNAGCNGTVCTACPTDACTDGISCGSTLFANCTPIPGTGFGTCAGTGCSPSTAVNSFLSSSCLPKGFAGSVTSVTGDQHTCNITTGSVSCHFGGTTCFDGGHAVDFGWSGLSGSYPTLYSAKQALVFASCPGVDTVRCELQGGAVDPSCTGNNHIHVNVSSGGCSCP
jgi:hypothetical protein